MDATKYLARQLNGSFISLLSEVFAESVEDTEPALKKIYELSIDSATGTNLDYIGQIVGLQRPILPENVIATSAFTFLDDGKDAEKGFASKTNPRGGAYFLSKAEVRGTTAPDSWYRQMLKGYAVLKWNGCTWESLCRVADIFVSRYAIYVNIADQLGDILIEGEGVTEPNRYLMNIILEGWSYAPQIEVAIEATFKEPDSTKWRLVGGGAIDSTYTG